MKRANISFHLVLVFGLGNQHACDECTQRQAQASEFGQPGQTERDEQQVQDKQLFALAPGNQCEPPAHHVLPADQQHGDEQHGLESRQCQCTHQVFAGGP